MVTALCILNLTAMMRHSVAPNRTSQASSTSHANTSAAAIAKLLEKKKEYEGVSALERASSLYLERLEALGGDCETMAKAGEGQCPTYASNQSINYCVLQFTVKYWPSGPKCSKF